MRSSACVRLGVYVCLPIVGCLGIWMVFTRVVFIALCFCFADYSTALSTALSTCVLLK